MGPQSDSVAVELGREDVEDLFEHAPCGYLTADKDGRISRANATLAAWLAVPPAELVGKRFSDLLTIGGKLFYETHFAPLLRMQGSFNEVALELACADGRKVPVLVNAVERYGPDGKPRFILITVFNASERRRYERNLLGAKQDAERAVEAERETSELKEQFIAVLGHDLRNPLASIASGIKLLDKEPITQHGRKVLALMQASVARASTLIDHVLDFARARMGGGFSLSVAESTNLAPVLEQVVAELRAISPERRIDACIEVPLPVRADPVRIGQLAANLLTNALTHGSAEEPVRFMARTTDDRFELSVANGGRPIPPAILKRLFQPFFRAAADERGQGLGLGLFIASEIANAHAGALTATSDDRETRFTFRMPRQGEGETAAA
jgi:phosphoserine phosphatase RsbU/P